MKQNTSAFIGIFLICIGVAILFREYFEFNQYFIRSFVFFIIGILGLIRAFSSKPRKGLYISTVLLLIGLYYILGDADLYYIERGLNTSVITLIFGIAFYPLFIFGKRNWKYMLYGNILIATGVVFLLFHLGIIPYLTFRSIIADYWPVLFIVVGVAYLIHGLIPAKKQVA